MQEQREDFMATLVEAAEKTIAEGYYEIRAAKANHLSLVESIVRSTCLPIIAEVKFRSPATGRLRKKGDVATIAGAYARGGARAISVLTEPKHFLGSLEYLRTVKGCVDIPVLMKDIVIDPVQVAAARAAGADAVLLIANVFTNRLCRSTLQELVSVAHSEGLEVLLETHTEEEYRLALRSEVDLVGINNRDLSTLKVSLDVSRRLLKGGRASKPVICESGFSDRREMDELRSLGASGFLVGSALMKASNIESATRALTGA